MSIASIEVIVDRIKTATEDSPIAVFKCEEYGKFDAVFGATLITRAKIKLGIGEHIGTFHRGDDIKKVTALLRRKV